MLLAANLLRCDPQVLRLGGWEAVLGAVRMQLSDVAEGPAAAASAALLPVLERVTLLLLARCACRPPAQQCHGCMSHVSSLITQALPPATTCVVPCRCVHMLLASC
jgi:hypothetical protein